MLPQKWRLPLISSCCLVSSLSIINVYSQLYWTIRPILCYTLTVRVAGPISQPTSRHTWSSHLCKALCCFRQKILCLSGKPMSPLKGWLVDWGCPGERKLLKKEELVFHLKNSVAAGTGMKIQHGLVGSVFKSTFSSGICSIYCKTKSVGQKQRNFPSKINYQISLTQSNQS